MYIYAFLSTSSSAHVEQSWPVAQVLMLALLLLGHLLYLKLFTPHPPALASTLGFFLFVWSVVVLLTPILDIVSGHFNLFFRLIKNIDALHFCWKYFNIFSVPGNERSKGLKITYTAWHILFYLLVNLYFFLWDMIFEKV